MRMTSIATATTSSTLAALSALHVGWGLGASFPFASREQLADSAAGSTEVPGPPECFAVAALLTGAAALVADIAPVGPVTRRLGLAGVALVLGGRGAVGVAGRTGSIVPWTPSAHFDRLDRRYYGPLCLLLAAGALVSGC